MECCKSKKCQLEKLSEVETLKFKNSRPRPEVSNAKKSNINSMKFVLLILIKDHLFYMF